MALQETLIAGGILVLTQFAVILAAFITLIVAFSRGDIGWGFFILLTAILGFILPAIFGDMNLLLLIGIMFSGTFIYWIAGGNDKKPKRPVRRAKTSSRRIKR